MKKYSSLILVYALFATLLLYWVENFYHPVYIIQMIQKIVTFLVIPLGVGYIFRKEIGRFGDFNKESLYYGMGFGVLSSLVIFIAYYFLRENIDWNSIRESVHARGVNQTTFLLAFMYIMFGNSLVEEYFFRGVIFRNIYHISRTFAYIGSSLLFSLYHITIFGTWFSGFILGLALLGLFIGGIFFAWLYKKTGGIWGAWIFHIFADLAILIIGYIHIFS